MGCALGISGNCPPKCKIVSPEIWESTSFVVEFYKVIDGYIKKSMVLSKANIIMRVRIIVANFSNAVLFFHTIKDDFSLLLSRDWPNAR